MFGIVSAILATIFGPRPGVVHEGEVIDPETGIRYNVTHYCDDPETCQVFK